MTEKLFYAKSYFENMKYWDEEDKYTMWYDTISSEG